MRVVHLTDLHFSSGTSLSQALGKRALGLANLHLRGRKLRFGGPAREQLVEDVLSVQPDLVIITGDLATLATPAEFELAHEALRPLMEQLPVVLLAGNHDRYTRQATREGFMEVLFRPWMEGGRWNPESRCWDHPASASKLPPRRFDHGKTSVICLDTAVPDLASRGRLRPDQLGRLESMLADRELDDRFVILALHYPLLTSDSLPYKHPTHGLVGIHKLLATVRRRAPKIVLHGHDHHWRVRLLRGDQQQPIVVVNGGSSGLAPLEGLEPGYFVLDIEGTELRQLHRRRFEDGRYEDQPIEIAYSRVGT